MPCGVFTTLAFFSAYVIIRRKNIFIFCVRLLCPVKAITRGKNKAKTLGVYIMITIKDLAEKAGVAPTTVSNVLHGRTEKMSKETLTRVQQVISASNYVTNMGARLLANYGSRIIGVIMIYSRREEQNAVQDPFYAEIIGALEKATRLNGYFMMHYTSGGVEESLKIAASWNTEGLIVLSCQANDCAKFEELSGIPVVFIDSYFDKSVRTLGNVGLQDYEGSRLITRHLLTQGHRHIAFLADAAVPLGVDKERLEGCKAALAQAGLLWDDADYLPLSFHEEERHAFLRALCRDHLRGYTALVFSSDFYAIDAVNILFSEGVRIPEDISVTGFDDNVFARVCRPPLTTVRQNPSRKAEAAMEMLLKMLRGEELAEQNIRLPVKLMVRESTKPLG